VAQSCRPSARKASNANLGQPIRIPRRDQGAPAETRRDGRTPLRFRKEVANIRPAASVPKMRGDVGPTRPIKACSNSFVRRLWVFGYAELLSRVQRIALTAGERGTTRYRGNIRGHVGSGLKVSPKRTGATADRARADQILDCAGQLGAAASHVARILTSGSEAAACATGSKYLPSPRRATGCRSQVEGYDSYASLLLADPSCRGSWTIQLAVRSAVGSQA